MFRPVPFVALMFFILVGSVAGGAAREPTQIVVDLGGGVNLKLVHIAPGEFEMGSNESAQQTAGFFKRNYGSDYPGTPCFESEHPQHRVRITEPFYLGANVFTAPVGQFKANAFGLYDMHGNAWQWCADWYDVDYYGKSFADDPNGPNRGNARVLRGGSWLDCPSFARSASRGCNSPNIRDNIDAGIRVARTLK